MYRHVVDFLEIDGFALDELSGKFKPVFHMIDHDDTARAQQSARFSRKQAHRPGTETTTVSRPRPLRSAVRPAVRSPARKSRFLE